MTMIGLNAAYGAVVAHNYGVVARQRRVAARAVHHGLLECPDAAAVRLLDDPDRRQADGIPRARARRAPPDLPSAAAEEHQRRDAVVRARTAVGVARGRAGRLSAPQARGVGAVRQTGRRREAQRRLAARRDAQGSARSLQEEEPARARVVGERRPPRPREARPAASTRRCRAAPGLVQPSSERRRMAPQAVRTPARRPAMAGQDVGRRAARRSTLAGQEGGRAISTPVER